ncbi:MAG TPA: T9SS type A sorting domain-containing protein, partial [Niastella sp.]
NTGYSFIHNDPVSGTNYYRLKMVDLDGHFTYSRIVSCLFMPENYVVRVLNNPFGESLQLQIDAKENTMMHMQLFDGTGRLLLQKNVSLTKGRNTVGLPAKRFSNGTYLLKISNADFQKMIKVLKAK